MISKLVVFVCLFLFVFDSHGEGYEVSYAPSSRDEYTFIRPPMDEIVTKASDFSKIVDSYPHLPNGRWVGEIRRINFTGAPFKERVFRHEDTAWLWDALYERSETSGGGKMWWDGLDGNNHQVTNIPVHLSYGDLSFSNREMFGLLSWTNRFITAHPQENQQLFDLNTESWPSKEELYERCSADLTPLKLSHTNYPPPKYSQIKKSNYIDLATDISEGPFIREPWLNNGNSPFYKGESKTSTYTGTAYTFSLVDNEYVPHQEDVDATETYQGNVVGRLSWSFTANKEKITYSSGWHAPENQEESGYYTSTKSTDTFTWKSYSITDFKESEESGGDGEGDADAGICYVSTGCNTNIMNVGNFERLKRKGYAIFTFSVSQYKTQDDEEIEDSEYIVAICEELADFVIAGSAGHESLVDDFNFREGEIVAIPKSNLKAMFEKAIEVAGITWKEEYMPSKDPSTYSLEELGDVHSPHRMSSITTSTIYQDVYWEVQYVTCEMDFKLKYGVQE